MARTRVAGWEEEENEVPEHERESREFLVIPLTALMERPDKVDIEEGMVARG